MVSSKSIPITGQAIAWGYSRSGPGRPVNQDSFLVCPDRRPSPRLLAAVADGMGGHRAGEVASRQALSALADAMADPSTSLREAVSSANAAVHRAAATCECWSGMGTTLTAILTRGSSFSLCHVGDSRAYLFSRDSGILTQLTCDHSLVEPTEEAVGALPGQNVLTRAVGVSKRVRIDGADHQARLGDLVLLCTDGVTKQLSHQVIQESLIAGPELAALPKMLVRQAAQRGERDDLTVVLVKWLLHPGGETS